MEIDDLLHADKELVCVQEATEYYLVSAFVCGVYYEDTNTSEAVNVSIFSLASLHL